MHNAIGIKISYYASEGSLIIRLTMTLKVHTLNNHHAIIIMFNIIILINIWRSKCSMTILKFKK